MRAFADTFPVVRTGVIQWVSALQSYWMSGIFFRRPRPAIEDRLLRLDGRLLGAVRLDAVVGRTPVPVLELLELAYLCAYPFVPIRRLNRTVLDRASVQVNTFPSGHAATAVAAGRLLPDLLVPLLATAGAIALSTVVGRYHYAADTLLGVAVGDGAWWITT